MAASQDPPSLTPLFQEPEPADPDRPGPPGAGRPPTHTTPDRHPAPDIHPAPDFHPTPPDTGHRPTPAGPDRRLAPDEAGRPVLIVDGANVVGSVPDGWWRDRPGAAARLRDNLAGLHMTGLPGLPAPVEVILVVEGRARDVPQGPPGVHVERATGSGDDKIVDLVRETAPTRRTVVVTADRGLRTRVTALGAEVRGPSTVPR